MGRLKSITTKQFLATILATSIFCFNLVADEKPAPAEAVITKNPKQSTGPGLIPEVDEVEPIVVGRKYWDQPPPDEIDQKEAPKKLSTSSPIGELDALETKQTNVGANGLPILPPKFMPAVNLNRNFEGKLVLKPRKLGFQNKFPYQLESFSGRRLAFLDMANMNAINPLHYNGKKINVLGKLEAIEEGSKDLVIRAKIIRLVE
ncbi:MAG: hypothetical protein P8N49_08330 [Opitutales bacterium]|nr:hypothetical protein [Opitutales bacterium]